MGMAAMAEVAERTLAGMGFELVDARASGGGRFLVIFIDRPGGITVDHCAEVSRQLSRVFEVEGIDYDRLEVSSPGLDRPLTKLADYARFSGEEAQVHLHELTDGVRRVKGILRGIANGAQGDCVLVETETGVRTIPFAVIDRGRLVPKIEWRKAK